MAIRYSGDVEVRVARYGARCHVAVRWPDGRGGVRRYSVDIGCRMRPGERVELFHDRVARGALVALARAVPKLPVERGWGGPQIRRVYQAPCPLG